MQAIVDCGEVHERSLVGPQKKERNSVVVVVLREIGDELQNEDAPLPPSAHDVLGLARVNHREKVGALKNLTDLGVAVVEVFSILELLICAGESFLLFFQFVPIQFLQALETVDFSEVGLIYPLHFSVAQALEFDQVLVLCRFHVLVLFLKTLSVILSCVFGQLF